MNRIVLIGNGFDLAHGLKTSYKDFIHDLWKRKINELKKEHINRIPDEDVEIKGIENYGNRLPGFIYTYEDLKNHSKPNVSNRLTLNYNGKNDYLKIITEQGNLKNWVDIENEYFKLLKKIISEISWLDKNIIKLNECFDRIKTYLETYLFEEYDLKSKNGEIKVNRKITELIYSYLRYDDFTTAGKEHFTNEIIQELNKMIEFYNKSENTYSTREHFDLFSYVTSKDENGKYVLNIGKLDRLLSDVSLSDVFLDFKPSNTLFLNFNYTQTELKYITNQSIQDKKFEINHIHGILKKKENPIIFGYGDEIGKDYVLLEDENNNDLLENVKSIRYLDTDNYKKLLEYIDSDKYQVIILGHSCGNSDRTLLNTLFEHENCVSIKPYYYQYKDDKGEIKDNYSDIVRNISRSFTDKKSMRDKVVNKTYTTWFSQKLD